jgi:hypothetical protein
LQGSPGRWLRPKRPCPCQLVALTAGQPRGRGRGWCPCQLGSLLVEGSESGLLKGDLAFEVEASTATVPSAELFEFALGGRALERSAAEQFALDHARPRHDNNARQHARRQEQLEQQRARAADRLASAMRSGAVVRLGWRSGVSRSIVSCSER